MTIIGAFILNFVLGGNVLFGGLFSTYYISMSIFLAYAATYPDNQVLFMMIIPLKIKWLGVAYVLMILAEMIQSGWAVRVAIICSLMNFIIFFFMTRNMSRYNPREIHRRKEFQRAVHRSQTTRESLNINVQSVEEQKKTESIWNSVSVPSVTAIMSIVRTICLHIRT